MSFLTSYFNLLEGTGENAVKCPFPHLFADGTEYFENRPSAHVNTEKGVFNCKSCGKGFNNQQFIRAITQCNEIDSYKLQEIFKDTQSKYEWDTSTNLSSKSYNRATNLGISDEVIKELSIKTPIHEDDTLAFPVFMFDQIVDIRIYNPGGTPKIRSVSGATNGTIIPFDIWKESPKARTTLITAGEKDMAIARSHGFNAITLTGGEKSLTKFPSYFKNRAVAICYDNDDAGRQGAIKLATQLYEYTQNIKVVTNFHEVCEENGEDITDFFMKYKKTKQDLIQFIKDTDLFVPEVTIEEEQIVEPGNCPLVDLYDASQHHVGELVQSNIQVVAVSEIAFRAPSVIIGTKTRTMEDDLSTMSKGQSVDWQLKGYNCENILHLIDSTLKEQQISDNIKKFLLKKPNEKYIVNNIKEEVTVYKMTVTDLYETADKDIQPMEYSAYSIGKKLESGKKYLIKYKLTPHPYKGQQLTMIIVNAEKASDSVTNFKVTQSVKDNLKKIQQLGTTLEEKIKALVEMNKYFIGYDGINKLIETIDLSFNTPLRFNFGRVSNVRGYLDTLIVGESRTGKSSTADALRKMYNLGTFTSLAGNSATIAGLIGGSFKMGQGAMQTKAGVIPQNHMGLIIFEEFGKSNKDVLKEITDIRSSNEVRIARVSGTTTLPALVRMIALTNVKTTNEIKSIASYPNGIAIVRELINTAEDIARYDVILILPDCGQVAIDPTWEPVQALDQQIYRDRVRWIWTRTPEQIKIDKDLEKYIVEQSNELNKKYPSHIKLFGTEAWKKIARVAIAVAGYTASASRDFENIIVTKECIDYAIKYLIDLYDNSTFKFKEYVDMEQRFTVVDEDGIANLQNIYDKFPGLVLQLEQQVEITKPMLESTTGLDPIEIRKGLQLLTRGFFIRVESTNIRPTERFRLTVHKINKKTNIGRVGE